MLAPQAPVTPAAGTIKSRAKSRLTALREMHGWNTDSPLIIKKAKVKSARQKERERVGMSKRMKHLGMVEELAPYGMTTRTEIKEKMAQRDKELADMKLRIERLEAKIKADEAAGSFARYKGLSDRANEEYEESREAKANANKKAAEAEAYAAALKEKEGSMRAAMEIEVGTKMQAEEEAQSARIVEMKKEMENQKEVHKRELEKAAVECERKVAEAAAKYDSKLQEEQSKMKAQLKKQGASALQKQITDLQKENKKIQGQLTKIRGRKRGHDAEKHRRVVLRNTINDHLAPRLAPVKKRKTKNSSNSTIADGSSL